MVAVAIDGDRLIRHLQLGHRLRGLVGRLVPPELLATIRVDLNLITKLRVLLELLLALLRLERRVKVGEVLITGLAESGRSVALILIHLWRLIVLYRLHLLAHQCWVRGDAG